MRGYRWVVVGLAALALLAIVAIFLRPAAPPSSAGAPLSGEAPTADRAPSPRRSASVPTLPDEPSVSPTTVVTGQVRLSEGLAPEWVGVEGCGATVPVDEAGRFALPADEICEARVLVRNGGAESRGPKRWVGPDTTTVALEAPEIPPWEPPVPPSWHEGANQGLTPQQRRDERLAYLKALLAEGTLSAEREDMTRQLVEQLERQRFE